MSAKKKKIHRTQVTRVMAIDRPFERTQLISSSHTNKKEPEKRKSAQLDLQVAPIGPLDEICSSKFTCYFYPWSLASREERRVRNVTGSKLQFQFANWHLDTSNEQLSNGRNRRTKGGELFRADEVVKFGGGKLFLGEKGLPKLHFAPDLPKVGPFCSI